MQLYGLKTCDTCRKARKALPQAQVIDVRDEGVPKAVLEKAHAQFGDALLNTRSTTWRGLSAEDREKPAMELLAAHPTLMKRPLIVTPDGMFLGWTTAVQKALTTG